jgi:hypothetical protein
MKKCNLVQINSEYKNVSKQRVFRREKLVERIHYLYQQDLNDLDVQYLLFTLNNKRYIGALRQFFIQNLALNPQH